MQFSNLKITPHIVSFSFLCTGLTTAYLGIQSYGTQAVLSKISAGAQLPAAEIHTLMLSLAAIESIANIILVATAISMLTFLFWLYKSYKNLAVLFQIPAKFSPIWAVAWFFVPILNLYKPYQVMLELWQQTFSQDTRQTFVVNHGPRIIQLWWLTNVANQITSFLTNGAADQVKTITSQNFAEVAKQYLPLMQYITISSLLSFLVIVGFIFLVFTITEAQKQKAQQLNLIK
ncbi:DUF4328 domain-containing protein [bacterium BFN5]|nr:DUF4328 domain-containing protein [bacterium BFN5]QJW44805.1 DUF4328 domain-containing protein [bacterium BFN5]